MIALALAAVLSSSDAQFVREAMHINDDELARAQIAINSTNSPQATYAGRVSSDFGAANIQLISIARRFRVTLDRLPSPAAGAPATAEPGSRTNGVTTHLLSTTLRPARYFQIEIAELRSASALDERESHNSENATLRAFARNALVAIQSDLKLAQRYSHEIRTR